MIEELADKNCDIQAVVERGINSSNILTELLEALKSKKETIRYNSFKILDKISELDPTLLYQHWDHFAKMLDSKKALDKHAAVYILANLTYVDNQMRFEKLFHKFYELLNDKSIIPPSHVALNSAKIIKAKPQLEQKITNKLLAIDKSGHEKERKDLIKSYIITAFDQYYEMSKSKKKIRNFAEKQLECRSPKTRRVASEFLKNHQ